jgi:deoxyribose-phosphate aldolase
MSIASKIDHTLLKPEATRPQVHKLVAEAIEHRFASVCVNPVFIADVARTLRNETDGAVKTCSVAGFPLGAAKATVKAIEATAAVKDGADEIDFVAHLPYLLNKDLANVKSEFLEIVKAVRAANPAVVVKVIIESGCLMADVDADEAEARIEIACQAARETGCDFVKTSTGFHGAGGATVEAVALMKKHSGGLYVKASGGIRSYDDAVAMIEAGADRLGCSAGVAIVTGAKAAGTGY